jgi:spermidine synthase
MRDTPTAYFWRGSGIGLALANHARHGRGLRVGVLGLGVGTLAAYGQAGDVYRFYEINPLVLRLANGQGGYFSFLKDSLADVRVVLGDARISLERELAAGERQRFDVLALDAFSSDSLPVHLITRDAFAVYLEHLAPGGVIAANITNRHLDLTPVLWQIARASGLKMVSIRVPAPADRDAAAPSVWILLARDEAVFAVPAIREKADPLVGYSTRIRLWTDDYSNLLQVIK